MIKRPEYYTKKILFGLLKIIFGNPHNNCTKPDFSLQRNILVIRLNNIGDALVTTPFLEQLNKNLNYKIDVLCHSRNSLVFINNKSIKELFILKKGIYNFVKCLFKLRKKIYYCIVDTHNDVSATVNLFLLFLKSKYRFGFNKSENNLYTKVIERPDASKTHIIEQILTLLILFGIQPDKNTAKVIYEFSEDSNVYINKFLTEHFPERKFLIGVNLFAGSMARYWGTEKFLRLMNFLKKYQVNTLLIAPEILPFKIDELENNFQLIKLNYVRLAALMSKLNLLITPDTSVVHLASAYKVPVFGLYVHFNTDEMLWKPYNTEFECAITKKATLDSIQYEEVESKLKPMLIRFGLKLKN